MDIQRKLDYLKNHLRIEESIPNCLMGATGAVARYKYQIDNINKLGFYHTFNYQKSDTRISYSNVPDYLNIIFSRKLPMEKDTYINRLKKYYGIEFLYKGYNSYDELLDDITFFTSNNELLISELDFYYIYQHRCYHRINDQHTMVIYNLDREKKILHCCEQIYGHVEFPLNDYQDFFNEVTAKIKRPFYLIRIQRTKPVSDKIGKEELLHDMECTLANLRSSEPQSGITAFKEFIHDFSLFIEQNKLTGNTVCYVPGFWSFMHDTMNSVKFLNELEKDYPLLRGGLLNKIREIMEVLSKKWLAAYMCTEYSYQKNSFSFIEELPPKLYELLNINIELCPYLEDFYIAIKKL